MKFKLLRLAVALLPFFGSGHVSAKLSNKPKRKEVKYAQKSVHLPHLSSKKVAFIDFLHPMILKANKEIMKERGQLLKAREHFIEKGTLPESKLNWLTDLHQAYGMSNFQLDLDRDWEELVKRVDIIPAPLVLAQAATESAWGASRFAVEGNNYFGHWCFTFSCGLIPKNRAPGAKHELRRFASPYESVLAYIRNLNSHRAYHAVRVIRADLRNQGKQISGGALAHGLTKYSSRGNVYIREVQNLIKHNQLERYHSLPLSVDG